MKLLFKRGKNKIVHKISDRLYILKGDLEKFEKYDGVHVYYEVNGCAVILGYIRNEILSQMSLDYVESRFQIFKANIMSCLNKESFNAAHEVYTSDFSYLNKLYDISEEQFNEFKIRYEFHLEKQKQEREDKYQAQLEEERLAELNRVNNIKVKLINDENVSGRDILDLINILDIECPLRTKGLINRCTEINSKSATLDGKKPSQETINNLFKYFKIVQNYVIENDEYTKLNEDEKKEIEALFK